MPRAPRSEGWTTIVKIVHHNKLVRDRVPEIVAANGAEPMTRVLAEDEYEGALRLKIREEANEVATAGSRAEVINELADLQEVVMALADAYNISHGEIEQIRRIKKMERGGFGGRVFLIETREEVH
jgi:predicted house-cleaning noncanonical NTP pyrophosphatase (MazG superfamily)